LRIERKPVIPICVSAIGPSGPKVRPEA